MKVSVLRQITALSVNSPMAMLLCQLAVVIKGFRPKAICLLRDVENFGVDAQHNAWGHTIKMFVDEGKTASLKE